MVVSVLAFSPSLLSPTPCEWLLLCSLLAPVLTSVTLPQIDDMNVKVGTIFLHLHKVSPRKAPQHRTVGRDKGMNKDQSKTKQTLRG